MGKIKALELLLTGELIGSEETLRIRLINAVLPGETFTEGILKIPRKITPKSLSAIQAVLDFGNLRSLPD